MINKYKEVLEELLGDNQVRNIRLEDDNLLLFETTMMDDKEKTCSIIIDAANKSYQGIHSFINDDFYFEFSRITEDGTLKPLDDDLEYNLNDLYSKTDDDPFNESEVSVVNGCGFTIDDEGNWIPEDSYDIYDYDFGDEEDLEPISSFEEMSDGSVEYTDRYGCFSIIYQDKEMKQTT